ncbi:hypothetical protein [Actinophytocola sediminis]
MSDDLSSPHRMKKPPQVSSDSGSATPLTPMAPLLPRAPDAEHDSGERPDVQVYLASEHEPAQGFGGESVVISMPDSTPADGVGGLTVTITRGSADGGPAVPLSEPVLMHRGVPLEEVAAGDGVPLLPAEEPVVGEPSLRHLTEPKSDPVGRGDEAPRPKDCGCDCDCSCGAAEDSAADGAGSAVPAGGHSDDPGDDPGDAADAEDAGWQPGDDADAAPAADHGQNPADHDNDSDCGDKPGDEHGGGAGDSISDTPAVPSQVGGESAPQEDPPPLVSGRRERAPDAPINTAGQDTPGEPAGDKMMRRLAYPPEGYPTAEQPAGDKMISRLAYPPGGYPTAEQPAGEKMMRKLAYPPGGYPTGGVPPVVPPPDSAPPGEGVAGQAAHAVEDEPAEGQGGDQASGGQGTGDQPAGGEGSGDHSVGGQSPGGEGAGGQGAGGEDAGEDGAGGQGAGGEGAGGQGAGGTADPNAPLPPLSGSDGGNLTFDEASYKKLISEMDGIELSLIDDAVSTNDAVITEKWLALPANQTWEPAIDVNTWTAAFGAKVVSFNENLRATFSTFTVGLTAAMEIFDETDDLALYPFSGFVSQYPDLNIGGGQVMGTGGAPPGFGIGGIGGNGGVGGVAGGGDAGGGAESQ